MKQTRGLTLIELVVSLAISSFLVMAAVSMTAEHTRLLGLTSEKVDMYQEARRAMDMMALDVRQAGVGIGYRPSGWFDGFSRGTFTVEGGAQFRSNNRTLALAAGDVPTDDLGIRRASGDFRTIADFDSTSGQMCAGGNFHSGDVVAFSSQQGLYAMTARIDGLAAAPCSEGDCLGGCVAFTWQPSPSFVSEPSALTASYAEGQVAAGFEHVVWFVNSVDGLGELRRASVTTERPCTSLDCGGTVASGVETLQVSLWSWDPTASAWVDITSDAQITNRDRLRMDLEMVVRGRSDFDVGVQPPVQLELEPGACVPTCGQTESCCTLGDPDLRRDPELGPAGDSLMRTPRAGRGGFSLLMVTLLVALVTVSSLVVLDLITSDQDLMGMERRSREAREAAEGGTMELINDEKMGALLPDLSADDLTADASPTTDTVFSSVRADGAELEYEGRVALLRTSPVLESSNARVRAVVYELEVTGHAAGHQAVVETQIYKMASSSPGLLQGRRHAH